jgi:thioredoxin
VTDDKENAMTIKTQEVIDKPQEMTDQSLRDTLLESDIPVLVDFWAPWCGPCRAVAPTLEQIAKSHAGRLLIAKVNTDQHQHSAASLGVQGIPTMILFHKGEEVDRLVGALPKPQLERWLEGRLTA